MRFRDGKPHYLWLPLSRRNERDSVSGSLHLRLQWSCEEADNPSDSSKTLMVEIALKGIGISFVEASVLKLPREVWRSAILLCRLQSANNPRACRKRIVAEMLAIAGLPGAHSVEGPMLNQLHAT